MSEPLAVMKPPAQAVMRAPVLVPALVTQPFDYHVPANTPVGALVEVTLAGKKRIGAVWDGASDAALPEHKIKAAHRVIETLPPLRESYRHWLDWIAAYTLAPRGAVLSLCGLAHAGKTTRALYKPPVFVPTLPPFTPDQAAAATALLQAATPILLDGVTGSGKTEVYFHAIAQMLGLASAPMPVAARSADLASHQPAELRAALGSMPMCGAMKNLSPPSTKQILILVPEIALTHQWLARFEQNFGAAPALWHSQTTPAHRHKVWQAVASGTARVVVGTRSALFLPFAELGLIVVDEEHDPSYKQDEGVLYHARDMAVARARFEGIPIVLASATPSLETLLNVRDGKYRVARLSQRFGAAGMPAVQLVDMLAHPPERGDFLSPVVYQAMHATLARGQQVLLFLNRRGYAPLLLCRGCGHRFTCTDCSAWLVVHGRKILEGGLPPSKKSHLACHHCGHREPVPVVCPSCGGDHENFAACGPGVERIAEEVRAMVALGATLPHGPPPSLPPPGAGARMAVLSSDEAVEAETWQAIERGDTDIIIGTQMVAKGHHFPRLTLVVVVDADAGLQGADLRAGERTYQLLHQLGGRAGRADDAGTVLIQTTQPHHPIMLALQQQDRHAVMTLEAEARQLGNWPPFGQLAAILLDGVEEATVRRAAQTLAKTAPHDPRIHVLGPAPAPLSKLRGQYRYRLLVKVASGLHLQRTLAAWLGNQKFAGVRMKIDINPYYFM